MNIALVVYSHYSRDARVRRYAQALARRGFSVDVICLKEKYIPKESNISLIHYPLDRIRQGRLWYVIEYLLFFLFCLFTLTLKHIRKNYCLIHINNMPDFLVFSTLIPKILGSKVILDMHDPMPELYMSKYQVKENNFIVQMLKISENICFQFADKILTANDAFKSLFLLRCHLVRGDTSLGDKISVILNCPDPKIFHRQQTTDNRKQFTLFYMGTVEKRFGLDIVLEAIPKIKSKIPNLQFVVIPKLENEGEYFQNLKSQISNLKLEKYIKILPPQPLENIAKYIKKADIGIVLAQNGVFTENIFPVKLLEFIQMNIPVIATKTKVLGNFFTEKQIFFLSQNSPDKFSQAVIKLYKEKKLRQALSTNAKKYLKTNNWPKEEKKYHKIANQLISAK